MGVGFFRKKHKRNCPKSFLWYLTVFSIREREKSIDPQHQEVVFKNMSIEKHEKKLQTNPTGFRFSMGFLSTLHEIYLFLYSSTHTPVLFGPKGQIRQVGIDVQTDKEHIKGQPRTSLKNRPRKPSGVCWLARFCWGGGWGNFKGICRA